MESSKDNLADPTRLAVLRQMGLLDSLPDAAFDRLTRLATRVLGVPISLVSLVEDDRQFFKSAVGLPPDLADARQTPLSHSFCQHVVQSGKPLIVEDAREHPVLKDNPVFASGVVAYAGFPLVTKEGLVLGSFCVLDDKPHEWTTGQIENLRDIADAAITEIELRQANDAKDRFFAMLSHDLRTPLSPALITAAQLASDDTLPERFREDVQLIHRNIELEGRMIDSLLDLTRITTGKLALHTEIIDVHRVLHASAKMCATSVAHKSVQLRFELNAKRHMLDGDAPKLQQVFCNLLTNAIKFSKSDSQITVRSTDGAGESLNIEVIDAGIGIDPDLLPHIFDAFQQGGRDVTQEFGGLGLGLAICKGIVDAHGGTISAHSSGQDEGATIAVTLPSSTAPQSAPIVPHATAYRAKRELTILLVEDHEDSLRAMSRLLRRLDYRVTTANCVNKAMDAASAETFDLLISDLGLPDGTGLDLMRELCARQPMKGIALTGYGMETDIQRTKEAGFQKHLTKPINFRELQAAIEEMT